MAFLKSIILEEFILQKNFSDSGSWEGKEESVFLSFNG